MALTLLMQAPQTGIGPIVPSHLMPSGNAYIIDANGQIRADPLDVGILQGFGFTTVGADLVTTTSLSGSELVGVTQNGVQKVAPVSQFGGSGPGGAAIIPETGSSPIKISAFTNPAVNGMAPTALLTGLDAAGGNANYTQAQILQGQNAAASSGAAGESIKVQAGHGDGVGAGGALYGYSGSGGSSKDSSGGLARFVAGNGYSYGGSIGLYAGAGVAGVGGFVYIRGGIGNAGYKGGGVRIYAGSGPPNGQIYLGSTNSGVGLPTTDPSKADAVWADNGVIVQSGIANYTGTTTIASIGTKTLTFSNGILISIA